ncbi:MAG: BamA/TamA family outer membrane protein [Elusimicrobia bacterium]|nr:BamA/TamA family outer membrane protein [Elusimicrobiota bacterium]
MRASAVAIGCVLAAFSRPAGADDSRVGDIVVELGNVFDTRKPGESAWLFRAANRLHIQTRPEVVERELLFARGEPFEPALLEETERNLRRFSFVRKARVAPKPKPDGTVDVLVRVDDAWTLSPTAGYRRVGETSEWRLSLGEQNVLGFGKSVSFEVKTGRRGPEQQFGYGDRQLLGSRLGFDVLAQKSAEHTLYELRLARPFHASISTHSWSFAAWRRSEVEPYFFAGVAAGRARRTEDSISASYGRSLGSTPRLLRQGNLSLGRTYRRYEATPETGAPLPERSARDTLSLGLRRERLRFVKVSDVLQMSRDEDYNVGLAVDGGVGVSPRWLTKEGDRVSQDLRLTKGRPLEGGFARLRLQLSNLAARDSRPTTNVGVDAVGYRRTGARNLLATRVRVQRIVNPGAGAALTLGEETGLRGYGLSPFSGDRLAVANLEDRFLLADDLFKIAAIGLAAFFDAGYVWRPDRPVRGSDLHSAVGLGLRVASSRSTQTTPLRIDVAYSLQENGRNTRWSVSIVGGHAFGPD